MGGSVRMRILGPLRLWRDDVEVDTGPRQQAHLLTLLLVRVGEPTSTGELIELLWGDDAPVTAVNVLQKYVGALRRLLEPSLPARDAGSYLHRHGDGYVFEAGPGMLDVVAFRELLEVAGALQSERRDDDALEAYVQALGRWHGHSGGGLAHGPAAMGLFTALDSQFYDACVTAAELALALGSPERVLQPLSLAAWMAPLHEPVQAALVALLSAAQRQAEALRVFEGVRNRLAEELGVEPGPALRAAHRRVLARPDAAVDTPAEGPPAWQRRAGLVGRAQELAVLRHAVEAARAGGTGLAVVEGEPGVGKTRVLEEIGAEADRRGTLVVWGRCLEGDGTPSMWPWVQVVGAILDALPTGARQEWRASEVGRLVEPRAAVPGSPVLPDSGARFRLFEETVSLVARVSAARPLLLVVDDLQWADLASLDLFGHLAARLPHGAAVIGALRDRAPGAGSALARLLATTSRLPHHRRVRLDPLDTAEVTELVRRETGAALEHGAARRIHARTAGNPFLVLELVRFLGEGAELSELSEQAAARPGVPATVRDIVRDRMATLAGDTELLHLAALIGRDVDVALLASAAGLDVQNCLDRLEPLLTLGLLDPLPDDPFAVRFPHDLVCEAVAWSTPPSLAPRLHLRLADTLERSAVDDERVAHHLWAAGPLADPDRTADALVRAGRSAAGKSALEAAASHLRSAAHVARAAGLTERELSALSLFVAVDGMRAGYVGSAPDLLQRAEHLARGLGREREAADFLFSRWAADSQGIRLDHGDRLARRLLDQGEASTDPVVRAYGQHAWGIHQWDLGNIGEAFRYLSRSQAPGRATGPEDPAGHEAARLRRDLQLLSPVMLALMTALHGDVHGARVRLDALEAAAGDDPYEVTVWAAFTVTVAALAEDPAWALRAAQRGIAVDPQHTFTFLGSYHRLARCWARAVLGEDPAGAAAAAEELIATALLDPPRSGLATWCGLLAEMWLAAGKPVEAEAALDRADRFLSTYGQRYPEGLLLLLRARLLQARGAPTDVVRAAAERAHARSTEREAHLFAHRAEQFLAELARDEAAEEPLNG